MIVKKRWDKYWNDIQDMKVTLLGKIIFFGKDRNLRKILKSLTKTKALDIGCGLGRTLTIINESGFEGSGIDISIESVKICKRKGLKVDNKRLEDMEGKYGLVFSDGLIEHFLNYDFFIKKHCQLSDKYVIIIQSNYDSPIMRLLSFLEIIFAKNKSVFEYNFRIDDYINEFRKNKFGLINKLNVFGGAYQILCFKKEP